MGNGRKEETGRKYNSLGEAIPLNGRLYMQVLGMGQITGWMAVVLEEALKIGVQKATSPVKRRTRTSQQMSNEWIL